MQTDVKIPRRVEFRIVNGKLIKVHTETMDIKPGTIAEAVEELIKEEL